ncbi:MAG TPA: M56 family metallopeptidase [Vicinamibacterales bacterium]|nr:M56 family metallopeptidase [Vicinamibacterales bacterium]
MADWARVLLATLSESAIRATLLAGLCGITLVSFRVRRPALRLYAWTFVLWASMAMPLIAVLMPTLPVPVGDWGLGRVFATGAAVTPESSDAELPSLGVSSADLRHREDRRKTASSVAARGPFTARAVTPAISAVAARAVLIAIYFAVLIVLLLRVGAGWKMARRLERTAPPIEDRVALAHLANVAESAGLRHAPRLTQSDRLCVPMTTSVIRPAVILPATWRTWTNETFNAVLVHEVAHIARRDAVTQRASLMYRAVFWFNPLAWWLRHHLIELAERASDEAVLSAGTGATEYARILLDFCHAVPRTGLRASWQIGMARGSVTRTEARITQILQWTQGGSTRMTASARVRVLVAATSVAMLIASLHPVGATPKPAVELVPGPSLPVAPATVTPGPVPAAKQPLTVPPGGAHAQPQVSAASVVPAIQGRPKYTPDEMREKILSQSQELPQQTPTIPQARFPADFDTSASRPGNGVSWPKDVSQAKPVYTPEARAAGVEGIVELELVVLADGTVGPVRVTKSLSRELGLDDEAIRAARQWIFKPGQLNGQAVPVRVPMQLEFRGANGRGARPSPAATSARLSPLADAFAKGAYLASGIGIVPPRNTYRVMPKYTPDGMRAKIQGEVDVEIVILADGTVGKARVVRSLDAATGLDEAALAAAKEWKFLPATLNGEPVPVLTTLTLTFRLRP